MWRGSSDNNYFSTKNAKKEEIVGFILSVDFLFHLKNNVIIPSSAFHSENYFRIIQFISVVSSYINPLPFLPFLSQPFLRNRRKMFPLPIITLLWLFCSLDSHFWFRIHWYKFSQKNLKVITRSPWIGRKRRQQSIRGTFFFQPLRWRKSSSVWWILLLLLLPLVINRKCPDLKVTPFEISIKTRFKELIKWEPWPITGYFNMRRAAAEMTPHCDAEKESYWNEWVLLQF